MNKTKILSVIKKFIESGKQTIDHDDGVWTIEIAEDKPYKTEAIPEAALSIGRNEIGDYLYLLPSESGTDMYDKKVYVYWHEEDKLTIFSPSIDSLFTKSESKISDFGAVFYNGGEIEVRLGDKISAKDFLLRKNGRVCYVPGISQVNKELEHDGMAWIGIRFDSGSMGGAYIDEKSHCVKKSVRFIEHSNEEYQPILPNEKF